MRPVRDQAGSTKTVARMAHHRTAFSAVVIATYTALGIVAYWPMFPGSSHRLPVQIYGDPVEVVWFFGWTAHALATAHNPFFSAAANVPYGIDMAQQTFAPLLGLLFAPVTLLFGPVSSVTVCWVVAMPLSATSAYAVLRHWHVWPPAAAVGGLAYGFSPYMINEGTQHLQFIFMPLPPLIVACLVRLLMRPRHPLRCGAALGALTAAQFLISSEFLAITAIVSLAGLGLAGAYNLQMHRDAVRATIGVAMRGAAVAAGVAGALLAYPIWFQFAGPGHYVGPPWPYLYGYNAHLLEFVAPTPNQLVRPVFAAAGSSWYAQSYLADDAYLGFGALLVIVVLVSACRRSPLIRLTAALGVLSAVLSFGPYTYIGTTRIFLPFWILTKLPAVGDIIPIRFSFATAACVAALLALGLEDIRRKAVTRWKPTAHEGNAPGWRGHLLPASVCLIVAVTWLPAWPLPTQSVSTLPPAVTRALPPGHPIVLTYPYPRIGQDTAMLWQAAAAFSFRLVGVYAMVPQRDGSPAPESPALDPAGVQEFLSGEGGGPDPTSPPDLSPMQMSLETRDFVLRHDVSAVLVSLSAPNAAKVAAVFSLALGQPSFTGQGFDLWKLAR